MQPAVQRKSLIAFYFGSTVATTDPNNKDAIEDVAQRAYRDLNRTLTGFGSHKNRKTLRETVLTSLFDFVQALGDVQTQGDFDERHQAWCEKTCLLFEEDPPTQRPFTFHYGQAQKWINMTMKYLAVLDHPEVQRVYEYLHVPIDFYVYKEASDIGVERPLPDPESKSRSTAWSRLSGKQYRNYQFQLRDKLNSLSEYPYPLDWEADIWSSRNKESSTPPN